MISNDKAIRDFVKSNVESILKSPRKFIKYPFIDPGSVYDGNVWDWDTYWSVYGLLNLLDDFDKETQDRIIEHSKGNIKNFLDHQLEDGYIPMMIEIGEWEEPYLNMKHKEGVIMNMHKPFLCSQIMLISDYIKDYKWFDKDIKKLIKYFECYDKYYFNEDCGLYVWADDIMIGVDNDPATFGRPKFSTANIFLNSFLVMELESMASICKIFEEETLYNNYMEKRRKLIECVQSECWDTRDKIFYSVDVDIKTREFEWFHKGLGVFWKTLPIKIRSWSSFLPMYAGFATDEQVKELVKHMFDENTFYSPYGITSLAKDEKMFDISVTNNPSNWLGPIWLVVNYIVFKSLLNYGYIKEAKILCDNTMKLLGSDLEKTGSLHEYYNPFDGEPVMNSGFVNWNILGVNMFDELNSYNDTKDYYSKENK